MRCLPLLPVLCFTLVGWLRAETAPAVPVPAAPTVAPAPAPAEIPLPDGLYAEWNTARGTIVAELFPERTPLTVANFVGLAEGTIKFEAPGRTPGRPYFDGLLFHRVVPGFVIQGGDPLGTGEGGPGYEFADELVPGLRHNAVGILSMANSGPATNGSQFFLTLAAPERLNYMHTVFGRVVRGLEVLPQIRQGDAMARVHILRVGAKAAAYRIDAAGFEKLRSAHPPLAPRDPARPPLFADEAKFGLPEWMPEWQNRKLHNYAAATKRTVFVRVVPKFGALPEGPAGENPLPQLFKALAGDDPDAALLVFVADEKSWRVWLGDGLVRRLGLDPAAVATEEGKKQLHALKEQLLAPARAAWDPAKPARTIDTAITTLLGTLDDAGAAP